MSGHCKDCKSNPCWCHYDDIPVIENPAQLTLASAHDCVERAAVEGAGTLVYATLMTEASILANIAVAESLVQMLSLLERRER